jgi:hypothetical protein
MRSHPAAVFRQATINLIYEVGNPLEIPVLGCTVLTQRRLMSQKKMSVQGFRQEEKV